jgi:hypothetical protein
MVFEKRGQDNGRRRKPQQAEENYITMIIIIYTCH